MIALVFVILKHSLQWRGEFHLHLGPVPDCLLDNSAAARWFLMAAGVDGKFFFQRSLFHDVFIEKSDIWCSVFNKYI